MKIVAIVQARMGSTRLPEKVMLDITGHSMIEILLKRLLRSKKIDQVILATSTSPNNARLISEAERLGIKFFQGSEDNVLSRFIVAAKKYNADLIVRITGDCPLVDSVLLDKMLRYFSLNNIDYLTNGFPPTFPDGMDIEIFTLKSLIESDKQDKSEYNREHVTPFIRESGMFKVKNFSIEDADLDCDFSSLRITVDEKADLEVVREIFEFFRPNIYFSWLEAVDFLKSRPDLLLKLDNLYRNEGATMSKGQKLWKRARAIIPGGNMLLSKRPEMFLPEKWPAYFSKAKGCRVWDLDGNAFDDLSIMGVGTNILGYGNDEVDAAVLQTVNSGNMSTLNCPEEVWLAEKLIDMHDWADMARFARSGGEANAIAIRIARAASGKDQVAVCGYHGWHDWYLSVNLDDEDGLDTHLLPGLSPNGVPKNLKNTVFPFNYNDFDQLLSIVDENNIGVIKMEVQRSEPPMNNFLLKVRELASSRGIVLIFDECTSGFRETFGGLHKKYGVDPDMAMFGKALGNGYAITAIIGRSSVMDCAQNSFISSTFWTERIGPSAALKTLEVMERERSWEQITEVGNVIRASWQEIADSHDIEISHTGLSALPAFGVNGEFSLEYKTLITQEMLKRGYLSGTSVYVSVAHTPKILENYFSSLDEIFSIIKQCKDGRAVSDFLETPLCHSQFKRLN